MGNRFGTCGKKSQFITPVEQISTYCPAPFFYVLTKNSLLSNQHVTFTPNRASLSWCLFVVKWPSTRTEMARIKQVYQKKYPPSSSSFPSFCLFPLQRLCVPALEHLHPRLASAPLLNNRPHIVFLPLY